MLRSASAIALSSIQLASPCAKSLSRDGQRSFWCRFVSAVAWRRLMAAIRNLRPLLCCVARGSWQPTCCRCAPALAPLLPLLCNRLIASFCILNAAPYIHRRPASCSSCGGRGGGRRGGRRCPARVQPVSDCAGLRHALERRRLRLCQALPLPVRWWASLGCVDLCVWSPLPASAAALQAQVDSLLLLCPSGPSLRPL